MWRLLAINPNPKLRVIQFGFVEEPASAFFSLAIVLVFGYEFRKGFGMLAQKGAFPLRKLSGITFWVWMAAYGSSTIFHIHETKVTERMDYFGAALGWSFMLYLSVCFMFSRDLGLFEFGIIAMPIVLFDVYYLYYMSNVKFDYGWHVQVVAAMVGMHFACYIYWFIRQRRHYGWLIVGAHLIMFAAAPLEIFDFAPLFGHFDGHSLWHAAGALISYLYCEFLIANCKWETRKQMSPSHSLVGFWGDSKSHAV